MTTTEKVPGQVCCCWATWFFWNFCPWGGNRAIAAGYVTWALDIMLHSGWQGWVGSWTFVRALSGGLMTTQGTWVELCSLYGQSTHEWKWISILWLLTYLSNKECCMKSTSMSIYSTGPCVLAFFWRVICISAWHSGVSKISGNLQNMKNINILDVSFGKKKPDQATAMLPKNNA